MFDLYENIRALCAAHGTTPSRLCADAGVSKSALSNLKSGRVASLSHATCERLAACLGEPLDRVMHGASADAPGAPDAQERRLLERLRASSASRALLESVADMSEDEIRIYAEFVRKLRNAD